MKKKFLLCLLIATLLSENSFAQRKGLSHKGNNSFKMEIIDIPENISSSFGTLKTSLVMSPQIKIFKTASNHFSHGSGGVQNHRIADESVDHKRDVKTRELQVWKQDTCSSKWQSLGTSIIVQNVKLHN